MGGVGEGFYLEGEIRGGGVCLLAVSHIFSFFY